MSEVTIETVQKELVQANNNIKGLIAQLEASKQMLNEQLASNLQLRTNMHMFNQANQEFVKDNSKLKQEADNLKQHIITLVAKVNELTPTTDPLAGECPNAINP